MVTVKDVLHMLEAWAPPVLKMDFDNVGLLVGHGDGEVCRIMTSLDITDAVIDEAIDCGAQLIVSHHPLFFSLKTVTDGDAIGRKILRLLENGIAAICMHTNLDAAVDGVNDALARAVGITAPELLTVDGTGPDGVPYCIGRAGQLNAPVVLEDYLAQVKAALGCSGLRYVCGSGMVYRVAVMGGAGGGDWQLAVDKGCDTYITADVKYNGFMDCQEAGLNLIDAGHFNTENVIVPVLRTRLAAAFPTVDVCISRLHGQTERYYV